MRISNLYLKNFRCLSQFTAQFSASLALITGENGSGKTSILEALHFACYLRSFRARSFKDLLAFQCENFLIKIAFKDLVQHDTQTIHIGVTQHKKLVKINEQTVRSYKDLIGYYRVITITEDDLELIKGGPELRRLFLDQALSLLYDNFISDMRQFRAVLEHRNALLYRGLPSGKQEYLIWSEQFWHHTNSIQEYRISFLKELEQKVTDLLAIIKPGASVSIKYYAKNSAAPSFDYFMKHNNRLYDQELIARRSLFGAHLDDVHITYFQKASKTYASRGQQKLIVLLMKIAQLQMVCEKQGSAILLLDDFMNDFDMATGITLLELLCSLSVQLIFTSPASDGKFEQELRRCNAQEIRLTI